MIVVCSIVSVDCRPSPHQQTQMNTIKRGEQKEQKKVLNRKILLAAFRCHYTHRYRTRARALCRVYYTFTGRHNGQCATLQALSAVSRVAIERTRGAVACIQVARALCNVTPCSVNTVAVPLSQPKLMRADGRSASILALSRTSSVRILPECRCLQACCANSEESSLCNAHASARGSFTITV